MKDEAQFLIDLRESKDSVWRTAAWLAKMGYRARILPQIERPDASRRAEFADDGDIEVTMVVEVKQRGFSFTGGNDYPYDDVLVDEVYKADKRGSRLLGYVILSACGGYAAVVRRETKQQWVKIRRFDKIQQRDCEFYSAPLPCVVWVEI